ncbi:hypothetical protein [Arsenophonus nasoniae]|uniref:Uncharacterized protein n=1 Tax=Arsenophonus nasoniae TaxID=638 RepID=A0AA95K7F5_9GAMM|nr:hypothetical protein [Arsenophonus nasoniae]WGM03320.1 hypothetical protein QE210_18115 [Arsenophonus nasoniae]
MLSTKSDVEKELNMFKGLSRRGKSIYIGAELRDRLDKIVLDIGHHVGRPVTAGEFIRYSVEKCGDEIRDRLKDILGSAEERKRSGEI